MTLREMGTVAQRKALRQGEIDVAIMYTLPDDEFSHHELTPESLVIALPESHALAARDSVRDQGTLYTIVSCFLPLK